MINLHFFLSLSFLQLQQQNWEEDNFDCIVFLYFENRKYYRFFHSKYLVTLNGCCHSCQSIFFHLNKKKAKNILKYFLATKVYGLNEKNLKLSLKKKTLEMIVFYSANENSQWKCNSANLHSSNDAIFCSRLKWFRLLLVFFPCCILITKEKSLFLFLNIFIYSKIHLKLIEFFIIPGNHT